MYVGSYTTFLFLFVAVGAMVTPLIKMLLSKLKESVLTVVVFLFGFFIMMIASIMSFIFSVEVFFGWFFLIIFFVGIVAGLQYIRFTYLIQMNTEKKYMGRVVAVAEIVWSLALFVGILFGSFFNDLFSYKVGFMLTAFVCLLGAMSFYFSRGKITW